MHAVYARAAQQQWSPPASAHDSATNMPCAMTVHRHHGVQCACQCSRVQQPTVATMEEPTAIGMQDAVAAVTRSTRDTGSHCCLQTGLGQPFGQWLASPS